MSKIVMGRIDPRLVHGRILPLWSAECGADGAVIIDDNLVKDDLMITIYQQTGERQHIPVAACTSDEYLELIAQNHFNGHSLLALFRTVEAAADAYKKGITFPILNVGAVVNAGDEFVQLNPSVALTKEMVEQLKELEDQGVDVRIQVLPNAARTELKQAIEKVAGEQ